MIAQPVGCPGRHSEPVINPQIRFPLPGWQENAKDRSAGKFEQGSLNEDV